MYFLFSVCEPSREASIGSLRLKLSSMKKILLVLIIFCLFTPLIQAQNRKADSLRAIATSSRPDTIRARALTELSRISLGSKDTVTLNDATEKLKLLYEKSKNPTIGNQYYLIRALYYEKIRRDVENSLDCFIKSYDCAKQAGDKVTMAKRASKIANYLLDMGKFKEAISYYYTAIKINEEMNNLVGASYAYYGVGEALRTQRNYKKALEVYYRAYKLAQKTGDEAALSAGYNNLGMIHNQMKNIDSALYYYDKSVEFNTRKGKELEVASTLDRIATIHMEKKENAEAVKVLERSLAIKLKHDDMQELAITYINLAEAYYGLEKDRESEKYVTKALEIAQEMKLADFIDYCYKLRGYIYKSEGKFEKAAAELVHYIEMHDSLVSRQNDRLVSEMEEKYQNDKKQKEIELLNKDKALKEEGMKKQKQLSIFIGIVAVLLAITGIVVFIGLRQKHKDNLILSEKNDIIQEQKSIVEEKNKEITDSITYARRIQNALLANERTMQSNLPPHFLLFKPKDIVSGDFYWATTVSGSPLVPGSDVHNKEHSEMQLQNKETGNQELFYLAVCDSTGHGVPGAFMSLLNIGFLSEAIKEKNIYEPNKIFDYVRSRLITTISAEGQKDGFDGILLCIEKSGEDKSARRITYAAAHNSPVLIREGNIVDLETDKMPVGYGERQDGFRLFTVNAKAGDSLYLFTDGYADQFGGPKGKKFLYRKLNELLLSVSTFNPEKQKEKLQQAFYDWKGNLEQVDDVCIIGIRL
jgi:serine phosphatase RsbU (regulator of sigma subunit)